jgi:hypothetical protein
MRFEQANLRLGELAIEVGRRKLSGDIAVHAHHVARAGHTVPDMEH